MNTIHAFVICAFGKSPYLENCIRSLLRQTAPSEIYIATSTPSEHIRRLARKYGLPLWVRQGESGIREDWLFAWREGGKRKRLITIAHQDDCYCRDYAKTVLAMYERYPDMTLFCSDYVTLKTRESRMADGTYYPVQTRICAGDLVRLVKKLLRLPIRFRFYANRTWVKKSALIFGNSICCPSCTYNYSLIGDHMFDSGYSFALDWENLLSLAERSGRFVCVEEPLIACRVHSGAATKKCIEDHRREADEASMFRRLWPDWMASLLMRFYKQSYKAYGEDS